jgi:hypothetical protein
MLVIIWRSRRQGAYIINGVENRRCRFIHEWLECVKRWDANLNVSIVISSVVIGAPAKGFHHNLALCYYMLNVDPLCFLYGIHKGCFYQQGLRIGLYLWTHYPLNHLPWKKRQPNLLLVRATWRTFLLSHASEVLSDHTQQRQLFRSRDLSQ